MTLDERCTTGVLSGKTHRSSFHDQRAQSDQLTKAPVDRARARRHFLTPFTQLQHLGMGNEAIREGVECFTDAFDGAYRNGGFPTDHHALARQLGFRNLPAFLTGLREDLVQLVFVFLDGCFDLFFGQLLASDQVTHVDGAG